jgi:hypothetical protein
VHIISKLAAVAIDSEIKPSSNKPVLSGKYASKPEVETLWASKALNLPSGRVVAVRRAGQQIEAGFIEKGTSALRWVLPSTVMSGAQERQWLRDAKFAPR